jgi:hypothetical protein
MSPEEKSPRIGLVVVTKGRSPAPQDAQSIALVGVLDNHPGTGFHDPRHLGQEGVWHVHVVKDPDS